MGGTLSLKNDPTSRLHSLNLKLSSIALIPCFRDLSQSQLQTIASRANLLDFKHNEILIREGTVGTLFGILVSGGKLQVSAVGPNDKEIMLCTQEPGYFFGEAAIIGNTNTTATIKSIGDTVILALTSEELNDITKKHPEIKERLMITVSMRLKQNILKVPIFAQMLSLLESKKYFKVLGAFDLLSALFDVESYNSKDTIFNEGDIGNKFYIVMEGCIKVTSNGILDGETITLAMLTKNAVFGEIALLLETTRTATAKAFEGSLLLSITREKFVNLSLVFPNFSEIVSSLLHDRTARSLKQVPFFSSISKSKRDVLGTMMEYGCCNSGDILVQESDSDYGLFIVTDGILEVKKLDKNGDEVIICEVGRNEVIGEIALLAECKRTATVVAVSDCRYLYMNNKNYKVLLSIVPELINPIVEMAQKRRLMSMSIMNNIGEGQVGMMTKIPEIDESTESKLYLYGLLRGVSIDDNNEHVYPERTTKGEDGEHVTEDELNQESNYLDMQIQSLLAGISLLELEAEAEAEAEGKGIDQQPSLKLKRTNSFPSNHKQTTSSQLKTIYLHPDYTHRYDEAGSAIKASQRIKFNGYKGKGASSPTGSPKLRVRQIGTKQNSYNYGRQDDDDSDDDSDDPAPNSSGKGSTNDMKEFEEFRRTLIGDPVNSNSNKNENDNDKDDSETRSLGNSPKLRSRRLTSRKDSFNKSLPSSPRCRNSSLLSSSDKNNNNNNDGVNSNLEELGSDLGMFSSVALSRRTDDEYLSGRNLSLRK